MIVHTKMSYEVPNDVIMYHEKRIEWNILISDCMPYTASYDVCNRVAICWINYFNVEIVIGLAYAFSCTALFLFFSFSELHFEC